jgi:hypothetical protein
LNLRRSLNQILSSLQFWNRLPFELGQLPFRQERTRLLLGKILETQGPVTAHIGSGLAFQPK